MQYAVQRRDIITETPHNIMQFNTLFWSIEATVTGETALWYHSLFYMMAFFLYDC